MKKAFTLIELIFVIVVIGILAAVAVPKFTNLKQSAEVASVVKTTIDTAKQAAEVALNLKELERENEFNLSDLVTLDGRGWKYIENSGNPYGAYIYNDTQNVYDTIAKVRLVRHQYKITYEINCSKFSDPKAKEKCKKLLNDKNYIFVEIPYS